jgi:HPr kinase/phosphorylase
MLKANGRPEVSVDMFLETARKELDLELMAGAGGVSRQIQEYTINRPGLALSGFFEYFAFRRIQVIGWAEHAYLSSLDSKTREKRIRDLFERKIPCIVFTRGKQIFPDVMRLAEEMNTAILKTRMVTGAFINSATILMANLTSPSACVQGTMVEIMGIGVLIEGKPGMGKSESALGLIRRGHALVSDDVTQMRLDSSGHLIATPVDVTRYHMEIRGVGIIHVPSLFGVASVREEKRLDLVVTLCVPGTRDEEDRSGQTLHTREILGVPVPQMFIPVAAGRDLTNIVETAALNFKLKRLGHDAVKELDEKLVRLMSEGRDATD